MSPLRPSEFEKGLPLSQQEEYARMRYQSNLRVRTAIKRILRDGSAYDRQEVLRAAEQWGIEV